MMRRTILLATLFAGCTESVEQPLPIEPWDLVKTRTMAGELPVVGIDSDRAGGLWIAYALVPGDAPPVDNVRIVHVGANGTKLAEFRSSDPMSRIQGLAFSGDALWLNISTSDDRYVRKIDPATGAQLATFPVDAGITDLDVDAERGELLLSSYYNRVIALDLVTGVETWRAQLSPIEPGYAGGQSAIAAANNGTLWVASRLTDRFEVRDVNHQVIASYTTEVAAYHNTTDYSLFIAWDPQVGQVIAATENQISWLTPREGL